MIVSSRVEFEPPAPDGRALATEYHTDKSGEVFVRSYLWDDSIKADQVLADRALQIDEQILAEHQEQVELVAAQKAVATVLDTAVKDGKLSEDQIEKAGVDKPSDVLAKPDPVFVADTVEP